MTDVGSSARTTMEESRNICSRSTIGSSFSSSARVRTGTWSRGQNPDNAFIMELPPVGPRSRSEGTGSFMVGGKDGDVVGDTVGEMADVGVVLAMGVSDATGMVGARVASMLGSGFTWFSGVAAADGP